tara:strand:+ start:663 stop:1325 length:663 start_codon:yes stop_codon:yes gene_type:complete
VLAVSPKFKLVDRNASLATQDPASSKSELIRLQCILENNNRGDSSNSNNNNNNNNNNDYQYRSGDFLLMVRYPYTPNFHANSVIVQVDGNGRKTVEGLFVVADRNILGRTFPAPLGGASNQPQVSERSERALRMTSILAMVLAKWLQTATSTTKQKVFHSFFGSLASPRSIKNAPRFARRSATTGTLEKGSATFSSSSSPLVSPPSASSPHSAESETSSY